MRFILLVFLSIPLVCATAQAQGLDPLLPLVSSASKLPLLEEALRDPSIRRSAISDGVAVEGIRNEISEYSADIRLAKGARKLELAKSLFENSVLLANYYHNVLNGTLEREGNPASQSDLAAARSNVVKYAKLYASLAKSRSEISRAQYSLHVHQYVMGKNQSSAVDALSKLENINTNLKRRVDLLVSIHNLNRGNQSMQQSSLAKLKSLGQSLHREGAIVARLAVARKLSQSKGKYRPFLLNATKQTSGLSQKQKEAVFSYATAVWRAGEGKKIDWSAPPLALANAGSLALVDGIKERQAIARHAKNQTNEAVSIYQKLSDKHKETPLSIRIDERILELRNGQYVRSKSPRNYETALNTARKKYAYDDAMSGDSKPASTSMRQKIESRHQRLVDGEINTARSKQTAKAARSATIGLTERYIDQIESPVVKEKYQAAAASLYAINGNHKTAVGIYSDLALNGPTASNRPGYVNAAISSQLIVANWPAVAPWTGSSNGSNPARQTLRTLYQMQIDAEPKVIRWPIIAQAGLLDIVLGNKAEAFVSWEKALEAVTSASKDSQFAAGYMLSDYRQNKNWQKQESLARLALKKSLSPIYRGKVLIPVNLLAIGLFEGGKEHLASGNFAVAVKKLKEFTTSFAVHRDQPEGLYLLAFAYRGNGEHSEALASLKNLVKTHPGSPFYSRALLNGSSWALDMAEEEEAIYFNTLYAKKYPTTKEAVEVRDQLTMLLLGRQLYALATDLLSDHLKSPHVNAEKRLATAVTIMDIEDRYGSEDRSFAAAASVIKLAGADQKALGMAYGIQVQYFNRMNNVKGLQDLAAKLSRLTSDSSEYELHECLGAARYFLAQRSAKFNENEIFSLELTDPLATITKQHAYYNDLKAQYNTVCQTESSSYCATAMQDTANHAGRLIDRIQDISIPETLPEATVNQFTAQKQSIIDRLGQDIERASKKSLEMAQVGTTNPDVTQQIMWENSTDWNFDRITGETGNSYIQFSPAIMTHANEAKEQL